MPPVERCELCEYWRPPLSPLEGDECGFCECPANSAAPLDRPKATDVCQMWRPRDAAAVALLRELRTLLGKT